MFVRRAVFCYRFLTTVLLVCAASLAHSDDAHVKSLILEQVSGGDWMQDARLHTGYASGRFYVEGSFKLPPNYHSAGASLIDALIKGEFEVVPPTQAGARLDQIPGYLNAKAQCADAPVRYWNGLREIPESEIEATRKGAAIGVVPYVPNQPRPVDYELQLQPGLKLYGQATQRFAYYDLGKSAKGNRLILFGAEGYAPVASHKPSGLLLEGSFAAFQLPSCRFVGTLDYFTNCYEPSGTPVRQRDGAHVAQVIRLKSRPFVVTVSHSVCKATKQVASEHMLHLWDLTAEGPVPAIYGFSRLVRE
jgi:hypothetical protein